MPSRRQPLPSPLDACALYLRVSTEDQTEANQEPELRQLVERRGWVPVV